MADVTFANAIGMLSFPLELLARGASSSGMTGATAIGAAEATTSDSSGLNFGFIDNGGGIGFTLTFLEVVGSSEIAPASLVLPGVAASTKLEPLEGFGALGAGRLGSREAVSIEMVVMEGDNDLAVGERFPVTGTGARMTGGDTGGTAASSSNKAVLLCPGIDLASKTSSSLRV